MCKSKTSYKGVDRVMLYGLWAFSIFIVSTYFFYRAAGTLSIKKLNIISFSYYNIMLMCFIGSTIILFGFKEHYMVEKIQSDTVIIKTYIFLSYTMIIFPLCLCVFNKILLGKKIGLKYEKYIHENVLCKENEKRVFLITLILVLIGFVCTCYMFKNIGYIPLLELVKGNATSTTRASVTNKYSGNIYIRNIVVLTLVPTISYYIYIYMRLQRDVKWKMLFVVSFVLSFFVKTYNLEKAPFIYYIFYFYFLEILLGNKNVYKFVKYFICFAGVLLVIMYAGFAGYRGSFLTLKNGPVARILITQPSTLFLHVQSFPLYHDYLKGASLPTAVAWLANSSESWLRSGKIVMQLYNARGVQAGEAGVMNAFFIGEAYANWGLLGVILAPMIVALPISLSYALLLKFAKTPLNIVLYLSFLITFTNSLQGGFAEYIYNANILIFIFVAVTMNAILNKGVIRYQYRKLL